MLYNIVARSRNNSSSYAILRTWYRSTRRVLLWRFNVADNSKTCILVFKYFPYIFDQFYSNVCL